MSSKPLRVTFVATLPLTSSTIVGRTIPLANELQKRGHEVNIITLGTQLDIADNLPVNAKVAGPSFRDGTDKPNPVQLASRYFAAKTGIKNTLRTGVRDIIVMVKPHPQNYAALKKTTLPVVLDADDDESRSSRSNPFERAWLKIIDKKAANKSCLITACSPYLVDRYKKMFPEKKVEFIATGLPEKISPHSISLRRYFNISDDAQVILYLGSLAISSGHRVDRVLEIWNEISSANLKLHLILAGDGIDADKIRSRAKLLSNSNRIHFFGRFEDGNSEDFSKQANLLIDPIDSSVANLAKSSSRTMLALKSGTPIVTGNIGIRTILVPHSLRSWVFYDTEKPESLTQAIKYGLSDEARQIFARETEGLWNQWTWTAIGAKFSSLIEEIEL